MDPSSKCLINVSGEELTSMSEIAIRLLAITDKTLYIT